MRNKFSGYLSIYNDWDLLIPALASMAPMLDELVVVDGAYEWMTPYLEQIGRNPVRSDDRVYDAIESSGIPYRVVSQTWKNEPEKRMAGYDACANQYVYRLDADEVMFFHPGALDRFLSSGGAVAEMEMPIYEAPGWIRAKDGADRIEGQCFLFDRNQVSSDIHLNYLWLVLVADALPKAGMRPFQVYPEAIAFNAHLTNWRTPATSIGRAAFYVLNYCRGHGAPWVEGLWEKPLEDLQALFDHVSPHQFLQTLLSSRIVAGEGELPDGWMLRPTPLTREQEASFIPCFETYLAGLAALNRDLAVDGRVNWSGERVTIDISSLAAVEALSRDGLVVIEASDDVLDARVELLTLVPHAPWQVRCELRHWRVGRYLGFQLPDDDAAELRFLRRTLEFSIWTSHPANPEGQLLRKYRTHTERPLPFATPKPE